MIYIKYSVPYIIVPAGTKSIIIQNQFDYTDVVILSVEGDGCVEMQIPVCLKYGRYNCYFINTDTVTIDMLCRIIPNSVLSKRKHLKINGVNTLFVFGEDKFLKNNIIKTTILIYAKD